jgi:hypothetical protein
LYFFCTLLYFLVLMVLSGTVLQILIFSGTLKHSIGLLALSCT